jgi:hypothetical protein
MPRPRTVALSLVAALVLVSPTHAATIVVDPSGAGDATTILDGVALAESGDDVLVRPGTYTASKLVLLPWGARIVNVEMKPGVRVVSEQGPKVTTIDGSGVFGGYGVLFPQSGRQAVLEGFTIRNVFVGCYVWKSSPLITRNVFLDHGAEAVQMNDASPRIESNTIIGVDTFGIRGQLGSTPIIRNNIVAFGDGVGVFCEVPGAIIECNDVVGHPLDFDGNCEPDATNFAADPLFCDPTGGNYSLRDDSPCAPGNHPGGEACGLVGALGIGCTLVDVDATPPDEIGVLSARPNPSRGGVRFVVPAGSAASLRIFDAVGRLVRDLAVPAAFDSRSVAWDGRTGSGRRVAPGVYYYDMELPSGRETRRIVMID